ncbi:Pleckstrin homology domain-containing protein [Aspergillus coremiiformis]|uniref:Pleckstrin homology domain-containing protein n=1 Tax=Aspergillus coremiiformis TaxID=138285 RepID=A0A5N6Z8X8_9EURO|nr:Pleckstrin homology domain-containing protein [Aspergillus coremiiformis]
MSDAQKPVEETPVTAPAAAPATEAPVETTATETPAAEAPKETPAENVEAPPAPAEDKKDEVAAEQPKEEAKEEVTPASEGLLGHKAPGLVKGLRFSKRFFYFSDDAVEGKQLSAFHQNEKPAVANPIAAWASQTGKGLLFFTKRAEDKNTPTGIFNLADVTDVTKEGSSEFLFKVNGHKHTFQAASAAERDSWVVAIEAKIAEAKVEKETVTSSEGYKAELEKLNKPAVAEPKKAAEKPAEPKEDAKEEATPAEDNKDSKAKSRSQSRKRASIFGTLLGKKEETEEKKENDKVEESKPVEAIPEPSAEASAVTETTEAPAPAEPTEIKEEKEEKKTEIKTKRASLFGNFFQKVTSPSHEKSEKEVSAPVETSAVASTAPQLDNPVEEAAAKPIEPESVTAPAEAEAAKDVTPASPAAETPKDKRRTSFFGNFGKKKGDSDNEAEGESKHKAKLGGLFRKPSKAVKSEPKDASATEADVKPEGAPKEATVPEAPEESAPAEPAATTDETKPANVPSTSATVQAAA